MSERPAVNIQWKGTDVCLDFQCECSDPDNAYEFHFDGIASGGRLRCPRCGSVWQLTHHPTITRATEDWGIADLTLEEETQ